MSITKDMIAAMTPEERHTLYKNARNLIGKDPDASNIVNWIMELGLPFSEGGSLHRDEPLVQAIEEIVNSPEGIAACEQAVDMGYPPLAGVDPMISA